MSEDNKRPQVPIQIRDMDDTYAFERRPLHLLKKQNYCTRETGNRMAHKLKRINCLRQWVWPRDAILRQRIHLLYPLLVHLLVASQFGVVLMEALDYLLLPNQRLAVLLNLRLQSPSGNCPPMRFGLPYLPSSLLLLAESQTKSSS